MMDGEVRLRPMNDSDLERVIRIEKAVFPEPWTRSAFRNVRTWPKCCCLVVEIDGCLQGYAIAWLEGEEYHLGNIAVVAEVRRRRLGSLLLRRVIERAGQYGARTLYLEVRQTNDDAIAFYRNHGFVTTGFRHDYYPGGINAVIMERDIGTRTA